MKNALAKKIVEFETIINFQPRWYSLLFNPYFINRAALYRATRRFAADYGKDKKILDVGCGIKPYRHLFTTDRYIGIDVEGGGHSQSQKDVDRFFDGINIPYETNSFDTVVTTEVLEHVKDVEPLIAEIHRVLKPGGVLLITMPFVWDEHEQPYDFQRFTSFKHRELLSRHGFSVTSIKKTTGIFATVGQLLSAFLFESFAGLLDALHLKFRFIYPLKKIFALLICLPLQLIALLFDWLFGQRGITLDYVVIAKKT